MKKLFKSILSIVIIAVAVSMIIKYVDLNSFLTKASSFFKGYSTELLSSDDDRYYYKQLNASQKLAYVAVVGGCEKYSKHIIIPTLSEDELKEMYTAVLYDNPELFYLSHACSINSYGKINFFVPDYTVDKDSIETEKNKLDKACNDFISGINYSMSDYEKELYIHDTLIKNCNYKDDGSTTCYTIYGALVLNEANCEGYSKAVSYLLSKVDIGSRVITGETKDSTSTDGHMWNIVTLDNKEYNLDVTWDDYTVEGISDCTDPGHTYMNVPTEFISITHTAENPEFNSSCIFNDMNYFIKSGTSFSSYDENARQSIIDAAVVSLENGYTSVEFAFTDQAAYNKAVLRIINGRDLSYIISGINEKSSVKISSTKAGSVNDSEEKIIRLFFFK